MNIETLKTFMILVKAGSFSKTAEIFHVSQSTISSRINDLEKELGKKLFYRKHHKIELTESGRFFLPYAEKIVNNWNFSINRLNSTTLFDDQISIGCVYSTLPNLFFPVYNDYLKNNPRISLKSIVNHSPNILMSLADESIDIALTYQLSPNPRFTSWICREDDFVLVVSKNSPLAKKTFIDIQEINSLNLIYHNWGGEFTEWISRITQHNRWFHATVGPADLALSIVKNGEDPTILTRSTVQKDLQEGSIVEIPFRGYPLPPRWKTYLTTTHQQLSRDPIREWIRTMEKHGLVMIPV